MSRLFSSARGLSRSLTSFQNKNTLFSTSSPTLAQFVRFLNLHEYQSKGLMAKYGIRVQRGETAESPEQAEQVANKLLADSKFNIKNKICSLYRTQYFYYLFLL